MKKISSSNILIKLLPLILTVITVNSTHSNTSPEIINNIDSNNTYQSPSFTYNSLSRPNNIMYDNQMVFRREMPLPQQSPLVNAGGTLQLPRPSVPCPCSVFRTCPPCGIAISQPVIDCPCAPALNCPKCPAASLIHDIASKKANEDQRLSQNLRSVSNKMSDVFETMQKYAAQVYHYELEAKEAAIKMEEASFKAHQARATMRLVIFYLI